MRVSQSIVRLAKPKPIAVGTTRPDWPIHWKDYEIGLVDLMSIPRATALLGADYLRKTPWRLGKEDVAWCRDESVLHEVKLSREFRILLGIQRGPVDKS